ncbi:prepilin-type N-terminal cleavage/methylation domain-containing protein [Campylobacter sp. CCUG 57310]|uniref:prepilin-type N-terminal cleavage/methylation domain-containing protein n=1 Tax=Campylobacter sp. CCUG 57310 TaxID=2517362 RepID=UPI001564A955|nr:prepilin-type N-terminal cleavage/methylation domain-containing protein [Campylobacter sp. CCUG 57310]QKF91958.1 putative type II secretion system protein [Campylobacter sp. CCUG 57310]
MKRAFTMVELVFVIVVIGILAGIAAPRLFATRDDAIITKARSDIASIKSAVVNFRNTNMLQGKFEYPNLEGSNNDVLFEAVLQNGIVPNSKSGWDLSGNDYKFNLAGSSITFTYDKTTGTFDCAEADKKKDLCNQLTK